MASSAFIEFIILYRKGQFRFPVLSMVKARIKNFILHGAAAARVKCGSVLLYPVPRNLCLVRIPR